MEIMKLHRLAVNNIVECEFIEHQKELEFWVTVICWLCLLQKTVKAL